MFETDTEEFYLKYLSANRPPRLKQTPPMCVGSSFDARVKAKAHSDIFGPGADPDYSFDKLFTDQVEEHNRDFALGAGDFCMAAYEASGAYDELLALLQQSTEPPQFEATLKGTIGGAPFLGKPDCRFVLDLGEGRISIVFDWKVKSFCSKWPASPSKGYKLCRDGWTGKASRSHGKSHSLYMEWVFRGLEINRDFMENSNKDYAEQCTLYGWLLGEPVGSEETLIFIDELVCKPQGDVTIGEYPLVRVAQHRSRCRAEFQLQLESRVTRCWDAIKTGHIFLDETREDSDTMIETLEDMSLGLASDGSKEEDFYSDCARPQFKR
jgi:hypothetical protein